MALSPDETLALVGATNKLDPADKTKLVVDSLIQVIDVAARPPRLVERVTLPHQPIGVSIDRQGNLALAVHFEGEVSVLWIDGS